jgi:hypothetical protein
MPCKTITLPIKCSTVHTISDLLDTMIDCEVIIAMITASAYLCQKVMWANQIYSQNLTVHAPSDVASLILLSVITIGLGLLYILINLETIFQHIPKLECIKDV